MSFSIRRLDHIQITVPSHGESEARRFYGDILGLPEIEKPEALKPNGGMWFQAADIQIHIGVEGPQAQSKRHPAFEVANLAALRAHLEHHGVRLKDDIPIPGIHRFSCFDPFGNRIEFLEKYHA